MTYSSVKCTLDIVRTELTCVEVNEDLIFSVFLYISRRVVFNFIY